MQKTELELLKEKVIKLEAKQNSCNHEWNETQKDYIKEPIYGTTRNGVDIGTSIIGYNNVPCWVRVCKKCGKKQVAVKMEEVIVKKELKPKFY